MLLNKRKRNGVGKFVILVSKKAQKGQLIHFMPVKESGKRAGAALKGR